MKKLLFLGACVASLVVSTSALAAVSYGENDTLKITSPESATTGTGNITSIKIDVANSFTADEKTKLSGAQMSVLVLDGNFTGKDAPSVTQSDILYIDQDVFGDVMFGDTNGSMGLLMPGTNTTLPVGSYTIKVGNDKSAAIKQTVLTISEDVQPVTATYGDVDGSGTITGTDASYVAQESVGKLTTKPHPNGDAAFTKAADVDGSGTITGTDASYIAQKSVGKLDGDKFPVEQ